MRLIADPKLDFKDVLIVPKRSTLKSRREVSLEKTYRFRNSEREWTGIPIIAANMDGVGTLEMAKALEDLSLMTALTKHLDTIDLYNHFIRVKTPPLFNHSLFSMGITEGDLERYNYLKSLVWIKMVCIDVANFYTEAAIGFLKQFRADNPGVVIFAGNVATPEITEEIILAGADVVKIGIGPGSACSTRIKTGVGYPQLSAIIECFEPNTLIQSANGTQKISEVRIGDEVKTHLGRFKKVTRIINKKNKGKVVKINGSVSTPNHEYYVLQKKYRSLVTDENIHEYAEWVSAEKLTSEYLCIAHI